MSGFQKIGKFFDLISTVFLMLLFSVVVIKAPDWTGTIRVQLNETGPVFFPRLLSGVGCVLLVMLLISQYRMYRKKGYIIEAEEQGETPTSRTFITVLIVLLFYCSILSTVGFLIDSLWLIPVLLLIVDIRSPKAISLYTGGALIVIYVFFIQLLHVSLPRGAGVFRGISLFFY